MQNSPAHVVLLATDAAAFASATGAKERFPEPDRILSGACRQVIQNQFSDPAKQFHVGLWACAGGRWKVRYTKFEFCTLLAGAIRLTDEAGQSVMMTKGQSFIIAAGFSGTFEVVEPVDKIYVIFEPRALAA